MSEYIETVKDNWSTVLLTAAAIYFFLRTAWLRSKVQKLDKDSRKEVYRLDTDWLKKYQSLELSYKQLQLEKPRPPSPPAIPEPPKPEKVLLLEEFHGMVNDLTDGVDDEYRADIIEKCTASFEQVMNCRKDVVT